MAAICRALFAVQITKKSVNPPALRRSSTTRSDAFLSWAAAIAVVTALGSLPAPDRARGARDVDAGFAVTPAVRVLLLGALAGDAFVFAMQVVYRSIQVVRVDVPGDRRRHEIVDAVTRGESSANPRGRHVTRARFDRKYPRLVRVDGFHVGRLESHRNVRNAVERSARSSSRTRDHREVRSLQDVRIRSPARNFCKCIGAEDEEKLRWLPAFNVQRSQGVDRVRRAASLQLTVGRPHPRI